jgi:hypothetical protein
MPDPFAQYAVGAKDDPFSAYAVKADKEPSTVQPLIGHPLTASDETPTAMDRLVNGFVDNPLIQGAAHPKELRDFTSLLLFNEVPTALRVARDTVRPVIAPVERAVATGLEKARALIPGGSAKNVIPFDKMAGRLRTNAQIAQDAAMGVTRNDVQFPRSTDATARALEPMESRAPAYHGEPAPITDEMRAQMAMDAERAPGGLLERLKTKDAAPAPRVSLREQFPAGLPREMPATVEPMASHTPSTGAIRTTSQPSMMESAELRAKQILPDVPPASGRVPTGHGSQPDNLLETLPDEPVASAMQQPRVDVGAERVGRANGMSKEQVRAQTAPILGEAQGAASPILPEKALQSIIDKMRTLPKGGPEREAYVAAATSGKAQWQIENIRRTLEHLGLLVPAAAAISPDVRGMLLSRMRSGVTGRDSQ